MKIKNRAPVKGNTIINKFSEFTEIIIYKQPFDYFVGSDVSLDLETGEIMKRKVHRTRRFVKDENGVLCPVRDNEKIEDIQRSIFNSFKRAKDNIYGYALCNKWRYFVTFTFDPKKVNRNDDEELKYCWKKFRRRLQYINKDVKILCCPERHETGELHLHALVGNIDLMPYITPAVNPHNDKFISRYGKQVFNLKLWEFGFTTLVELERDYNEFRVASYLIKYITKDGNVGYNKKKYYRTYNLDFKSKEIFLLGWVEQCELVGEVKPYKSSDRFTVYRIYNAPVKQIELDLEKT